MRDKEAGEHTCLARKTSPIFNVCYFCAFLGHSWCRTLHRVDSSGQSVFVDKQCVSEEQCRMDDVGCRASDDVTGAHDCVTCCNESYCNEPAPANHSSALDLSQPYFTPVNSVTSLSPSHACVYVTLACAVLGNILHARVSQT